MAEFVHQAARQLSAGSDSLPGWFNTRRSMSAKAAWLRLSGSMRGTVPLAEGPCRRLPTRNDEARLDAKRAPSQNKSLSAGEAVRQPRSQPPILHSGPAAEPGVPAPLNTCFFLSFSIQCHSSPSLRWVNLPFGLDDANTMALTLLWGRALGQNNQDGLGAALVRLQGKRGLPIQGNMRAQNRPEGRASGAAARSRRTPVVTSAGCRPFSRR
jgi:hypothetical protein